MRAFRDEDVPQDEYREPGLWQKLRRYPGSKLFDAAADWAEGSRGRTLMVGVVAMGVVLAWFLLVVLIFARPAGASEPAVGGVQAVTVVAGEHPGLCV